MKSLLLNGILLYALSALPGSLLFLSSHRPYLTLPILSFDVAWLDFKAPLHIVPCLQVLFSFHVTQCYVAEKRRLLGVHLVPCGLEFLSTRQLGVMLPFLGCSIQPSLKAIEDIISLIHKVQ